MRAHFSRHLTFVLVGSVLALAVLVSDQYVPGLPQQPERLPAAVVTLGDSTLSGEGGGNYTSGTSGEDGNWCHRSAAAPVQRMPLPPTVTRINLACSGAESDLVGFESDPAHAEESQAKQLAELAQRYRITDVVVQTGANDNPAFTDLVTRCNEAWARRAPQGCSQEMLHEWPKRVEAMKPKVVSALRDVRTAMDRAGYTPASYSLVVQSYASPVGPDIPPELQNLSGCPFLTPDLRWIKETGVPQLSDGLRDAAEEVDARFLDLSRAGHGHEACTGGAQTGNEWFTRLTVDWEALQYERRAPHAMQASFHANATGHAQLGHCLGTFLARSDAHAVCSPDERGNLQPVSPVIAAQGTPP